MLAALLALVMIVAAAPLSAFAASKTNLKAANLQVNHMTSPVGIDGKKVRLSWIPTGSQSQTAYQVILKNDKGKTVEDSGKEKSNQTFYQIRKNLPYKTAYKWSVKLWDEKGNSSKTAEGRFETGIETKEIKAKWINPELTPDSTKRQPASYLKKTFTVKDFNPKKDNARLYMTCHGIFYAYLNGKNVSKNMYMPGTSQYNKRLMLETLDVTSYLKQGRNELVVVLGDGWYRGTMGSEQYTNSYGTDIALLGQLELNKKPILTTDNTWQASQNGPLGLNDHMNGETYDARKWPVSDWHEVKTENFSLDNLYNVDTVPMRAKESFPVKKVIHTPNGETVLDFGQNISGYVEMNFQGTAGRTMKLTHGEVLDKNGNFTISNFQNAPDDSNSAVKAMAAVLNRGPVKQEVNYTCKDGQNKYHARMCYMGFRYVKVEADFSIDPSWFTAHAVYSDVPVTSSFSCGNREVNQLYQNTLWSFKGNLMDVPTDCPTREKSGYTGDINTFVHTGLYLMDFYPVANKWLSEVQAGQYDDGNIRMKDPFAQDTFFDGSVGWSDSAEIIPSKLYERYNDEAPIRTYYTMAKKYVDYNLNKAKVTRPSTMRKLPKRLWNYCLDSTVLWGEWMEPNVDIVKYMQDLFLKGDPEVGTAYLYYGCHLVSQMAEVLGKDSDARKYADAASKAQEAYLTLYVKDGKISSDRQCQYVRPIAMGIINGTTADENAAILAKKIKENGNKLNTGFLTTHELCRVLTDHGQKQTAYDLLLQNQYPSWLYEVEHGATTIWEQWDGVKADGTLNGSMNHYAFGSVVGWLFDRVAGINVEYGNITLRPFPDKRLGHVNAAYNSPLGRIVSSWKYQGDSLVFEFTVPCNQKAKIVLPNGETHIAKAGSYTYTIPSI